MLREPWSVNRWRLLRLRHPDGSPASGSSVQLRAIPSTARRGDLVRALEKLEKHGARVARGAHDFVRKNPLAHRRVVGRAMRSNSCIGAAWRLRIRVGVI